MGYPNVTEIRLEPFFNPWATCCNCGCDVELKYWTPTYGIPMYEDLPVPPEWEGEWGGFPACKPCFDKYEAGELKMWTVEQLQWTTRKNP